MSGHRRGMPHFASAGAVRSAKSNAISADVGSADELAERRTKAKSRMERVAAETESSAVQALLMKLGEEHGESDMPSVFLQSDEKAVLDGSLLYPNTSSSMGMPVEEQADVNYALPLGGDPLYPVPANEVIPSACNDSYYSGGAPRAALPTTSAVGGALGRITNAANNQLSEIDRGVFRPGWHELATPGRHTVKI